MIFHENNRFICLSGMDGTGKSAHIAIILEKLDTIGRSYKYIWMRRPYLLSLVILAYCRLVGLTRYSYSSGERYGSWQFYRSKLVSAIFPWVQLLDAAIITFFKVRLPLWLNKTVVCDRFIYDTLIDTMLGIKDYEMYKKRIGRLFLSLIPIGGYTLLLDCDETIVKHRKPEMANDTDLEIRRRLYLNIANSLGIRVVNTDQPFEVVQKDVLGYIFG